MTLDHTKRIWIKPVYNYMKYNWHLETRQFKFLDSNQLYTMKYVNFTAQLEIEEYPISFEDSFRMLDSDKYYRVSYIYCSPDWLEAWFEEDKDRDVTIQLRINYKNTFYQCVVRPNTSKYTKEEAIRQGAIQL